MRTEELYRRHRRLVGGLCHALLRDAAEAEDAAQQTFLSAHRALVNGSSPEEPAAWLATIARNECWARIRSRMREPLPTADADQEPSSSDPLAEAIRNADLAAMWSAIAELPRQQRNALLLREFGGLSYEELAGALAVSDSAVESLLFRARQGVRTRLKTAYAGVTGASWLESLVRVAAGLGGGMTPVAAKVAVVSVGAAVATGGAVVGPQMIEHGKRSPHRAAPSDAKAKTAPAIAQSVVPIYADSIPARAPTPTTAALREPPAHEADAGGTSSSHDDGSSDLGDRSSSGEQRAARSDQRTSRSGERSSTSDDGRESEPSRSSDSPASAGGAIRPSEDATRESDQAESASPPSGGGEVATTTTTSPVVDVAVPAADAPSAAEMPEGGDDGSTTH